MTFKGLLIEESEKARKLAPVNGARGFWIPKSVFLYYLRDRDGFVTFKVERWKERDIVAAGFDEV